MPNTDPRANHGVFERLSAAGDVDGLLELYEENAVYVASAESVLRGRDAIRGALQMMVDMGFETKLELVSLVEVGELALEKSRWTTQITAEDGTTTQSTGISTVILRRQPAGHWLIVVDNPGLD